MRRNCARQRQRLSLRVDGELRLRERLPLIAHLLRCVECRAFRRELVGFTAALRSSAVRAPRLVVLRGPAVAAVAIALMGAAVGLKSLRTHEAGAAGALSPVQGMPVYNAPTQGFPVYLGKDRAS